MKKRKPPKRSIRWRNRNPSRKITAKKKILCGLCRGYHIKGDFCKT